MHNTPNPSKTVEYVRNLKAGNHGIFFYRSLHEKHEVLFSFLESGFKKRERGIYVATEETSKQIHKHMEDFGFNVKALERDGVLRICNYDGWYVVNGEVDVTHTKMMWKHEFDEAMESGFKGLRGCGELACFFKHKKEKELVEYELGLGRKLDPPMAALCAYDVNHVKSLEEKLFFSLIKAHGSVVTSSFAREVEFEDFFPTIIEGVLENVFGEMGREIILIMLDKNHSLTPGARERRIAEDPEFFVEALEELLGSGAVVVKKSVAREMFWKMGIT